jgi:hypothetical protein
MNLASCFPPRFRSIVKLVSCPENENGNLCFVMPPLVVWLEEQAKVIEHSFCYVIYSTFVRNGIYSTCAFSYQQYLLPIPYKNAKII